MSITAGGVTASTTPSSSGSFDANLDIAKSSKLIADHMKASGTGAISKTDLETMSKSAPANVAAAASYLLKHEDAFTAIETHDVAQKDDFSGTWNFEWAANGGLSGTAIDAIAKMEDAFDRAIGKSAEITEKTTAAKTELDATKQRPQN